MDPENFSYQRDSPHANAVEVPDSFQAGILLSAVQERRYPDAGTSPTKFHSENYWNGAAIVLGAIIHALSMYSLVRRRERYLIIYTCDAPWWHYPKSSPFIDCQAIEMNQLVALAHRHVECTGQTIALRRTTTVSLEPLGLIWNSYIQSKVGQTRHDAPTSPVGDWSHE